MDRLRVGVDARPLAEPPNGIRRWLEEILGPMSQVAPDIEWVLFVPKKGIVPPDGVEAQVFVVPGSTRAMLRPIWEVGRLPGALRRAGADVFLSSYGVVPLRCPVPTVSVVHDLTFLRWPQLLPLRYRFYWKWMSRTVSRAQKIVVPSNATRRAVTSCLGIHDRRINVVPHAPGGVFAPRSAEGVGRISERFGLPERFVLAVGTLEPRKNHDVLIAAMDLINADRADPFGLVLAGRRGWGEGEPRRSWLYHVESADDEDLQDLYSAAAVFAMPSLDEGFGLPAIEAMACGAPVIVSLAGALPEVVGDAGLKVEPDDVDAWARALHLVLDDHSIADDLMRRSLARAETFSWAKSAEAIAEVLRQARG